MFLLLVDPRLGTDMARIVSMMGGGIPVIQYNGTLRPGDETTGNILTGLDALGPGARIRTGGGWVVDGAGELTLR